jgi:hypothetical protein
MARLGHGHPYIPYELDRLSTFCHFDCYPPTDDADEFTYAQNLLFLITLSIFFRAIAYVAVLKRGPVFDTSL